MEHQTGLEPVTFSLATRRTGQTVLLMHRLRGFPPIAAHHNEVTEATYRTAPEGVEERDFWITRTRVQLSNTFQHKIILIILSTNRWLSCQSVQRD